jgi:hypothetical protein
VRRFGVYTSVAAVLRTRVADVAIARVDDEGRVRAARLPGRTLGPNRGLKDAAGGDGQTDNNQPDEGQCNSHAHQPGKPELLFGHSADGSADALSLHTAKGARRCMLDIRAGGDWPVCR